MLGERCRQSCVASQLTTGTVPHPATVPDATFSGRDSSLDSWDSRLGELACWIPSLDSVGSMDSLWILFGFLRLTAAKAI